MQKHFFIVLQYLLPQRLLTAFIGWLADSRIVWIKNTFIRWFAKHYKIDMTEAEQSALSAYPTFNSFFIRALKPHARPITQGLCAIAGPADGVIAQIGKADKKLLLQAKNHYYNLSSLLADEMLAEQFADGDFATIYLAPHNYHRVHAPLSGELLQTIYVPGKLFSVNRLTAETVPNLYARNERLISIFATEAGQMAVILVGAMIVGSIKTMWMDQPLRQNKIVKQSFNAIHLTKGSELGYFKLGSTVIVLFEKNRTIWSTNYKINSTIRVGELLGEYVSKH